MLRLTSNFIFELCFDHMPKLMSFYCGREWRSLHHGMWGFGYLVLDTDLVKLWHWLLHQD